MAKWVGSQRSLYPLIYLMLKAENVLLEKDGVKVPGGHHITGADGPIDPSSQPPLFLTVRLGCAGELSSFPLGTAQLFLELLPEGRLSFLLECFPLLRGLAIIGVSISV